MKRSEIHQRDGMTAQRGWGWDLHEMREAAMMDEPMLDEASEGPRPAPTVSGFTAINNPRYFDTALICPKQEETAVKSQSANKPRAPKRRKTQPSAATTASKPKKAPSSKKTKRAKTAAQLDCQDISQGLSRTKPTSSRNGALHANVQGKSLSQATPPTPPKSDEVEAVINYNDQSYGQDFATEQQAGSNVHVEPSVQRNPESDDGVIIRDFGAPPFTQTSPRTVQKCGNFQRKMLMDGFDPLNSISDDLFEVDDIKCGDYGEQDEFPMDNECLEEMMQSMTVPAEEEPLSSDWLPRDFSDNSPFIDGQLENDQSHWPGAIPDSDGIFIYDENPALAVSDIIDVPSSPQLSSQASCILTHVTGNANVDPGRRRTSEVPENCFDDNDLDDGLIDLIADESKSSQVTFPVTPAKRPLSPKLQWLSPKTYTPAKLSPKPVFPTDDPHIVPVNSNGDILPFMRPPFPKAVRDRSPILGLTNRTVLRICFRIGEALNAAAVASRTNVDSIIELYARVVSSSREASEGYKQSFQFADLFTDKPPYLSGTYIFWKGVDLWDNDSRGLIGEQGRGKMVRVLGRIKRKEPGQGQGPGVEMNILSIWEVDWEDVGVAKGIACPKEK